MTKDGSKRDTTFDRLLTPKQVAQSLQVSEASVKRWCDKGIIAAQYTEGGHRRISVTRLLDYVRSSGRHLVHPELLGLPASLGQAGRQLDGLVEPLVTALIEGDEQQSRRLVLDLYLAEHALSSLCDRVLTRAFEIVGERWECGLTEVYQERRACEIMLRVLHELRLMVPPLPTDAPLALGGVVEGDSYQLATTMVELVLRDARWNAVSLGNNLPLETLAAALKTHRPRLFWLSCSRLVDEAEFLRGYRALYDEFGMDIAFVVGGRALTEPVRREMRYAAYCDNLQHLESFAQALRGSIRTPEI
ncbi:MAG: MerR family transcriptional regulator [Planctomycetota bacterium]